ncbi:MAG TPA: hypothetical protein VFL47_05865, partial [Flavisolibacter sp.]|nr:hypothetical protein [Flavisolibacter sp.]
MRSVLFISLMNGVAWGGSEELWFQTALYAARQGYKVGCAFYDWPQKKERIEQLRNAGCEVYLFSNKGREKRTILQRITYKFTRLNVKRFAQSLPIAQYDMTVINLGYLEIVSHHWKRFYTFLNRYALLFHVHNENENIKESRKDLAKRWIAGASQTLFASARTKEFFEKQLDITLPNAKTLINPLSFEAPQHCQPYPPLHNGNLLFVMLATLDVKRKAQDNLIRVLSTDQWKERPWQLFLYGSG